MGKIVKHNQPCPACGSSDARQIYENGSSHCFSCKKNFKGDTVVSPSPPLRKKPSVTLEEINEFAVRGFQERGITKNVCEFFGVKVSYNDSGEIDTHYYPYQDKNKETSYKVRKLPKEFYWVGKSAHLFGHHLFSPGGKRLIICEGEIDALSVAQASFKRYQKIYPVVALPGASFAKHLLEYRDFIRSFKEVVICMDNDEAGEAALKEAMRIVGLDIGKVPKYPPDCKDCNDVLVKHGSSTLNEMIWDAHSWSPSGILRKTALYAAMTEYNLKPYIPYPACLEGINSKIKGMRGGEIALFVSGTGAGKSSLIREIVWELLQSTQSLIGIVALEEAPGETARKLSALPLNKNPAHKEIPQEELDVGFEQVFGSDRLLVLDHQGSMTDDSLPDLLEYMCLSGCKYIFIDHLTILISEGVEGLTGNEAQDKVMADLLRLVKKHDDVYIGLVSHLRKTTNTGKSFEEGRMPNLDDIRGSGSTKQISMDIIAFARDMTATDEHVRNTINMSVLKCRYTGLTGPVPGAFYNYETGRLRALPPEGFEVL